MLQRGYSTIKKDTVQQTHCKYTICCKPIQYAANNMLLKHEQIQPAANNKKKLGKSANYGSIGEVLQTTRGKQLLTHMGPDPL